MKWKIIFMFIFIYSLIFTGTANISITNIGTVSISGSIHSSNKVSTDLELISIATTIESDRKNIQVGELVNFKIKITNNYKSELNEISTYIILPRGFNYIKNIIKVAGFTITEVEKHPNNIILKIEGKLNSGDELEFIAVCQAAMGIKKGINIINTKSLGIVIGGNIGSNTASTNINVIEDKLLNTGVIFGRVFIDENKNGVLDEGEQGIPGAKIYLENGHFVYTDIEGKYSMFGERALTHVLKLDSFSIPKRGRLAKLDSRYSEDGSQVFADVKKSEFYKVNFAFHDVSMSFLEEIKKRSDMKNLPTELSQVIEKNEFVFKTFDSKSGKIDSSGYFSGQKDTLQKAMEEIQKAKEQKKIEEYLAKEKKNEKTPEEMTKELEHKLDNSNNTLDIINLKDKELVSKIISIQIKSKLGDSMEVYLNDNLIPYKLLGTSGESIKNDLSFYEYVGIELKQGNNKIRAVSTFEGMKKVKEIEVIFASGVETIELNYNKKDLVADIQKAVDFTLILKDKNGNVISKPYFVSIVNDKGSWLSQDIAPNDPGLQFISSGLETKLKFLPFPETGETEFKIFVDGKEKNYKIDFKAPKRPLLINAIIEGRVNSKSNGISLESGDDFFEDSFSRRTAIFSTGSLNEEYNLTLSYDNTKTDDEVFFQKLVADDFYLVYGDNSIRGYEAQSTSKLYLMLENDNSKYLYGDYSLSWSDDSVDIGSYSRILNGYNYKYKSDKIEAEAFLSNTNSVQVIDEFPGRGVSGPYQLSRGNISENSEQVKIIMYDKNNPSIELIQVDAPPYTIDYDTGVIYFNTIIPEFDKKGNILKIRVTYEIDSKSGKKYNVYGGNLKYHFNEMVSVQGVWVKDENPETDYENRSYNFTVDMDTKGKIILETGQTVHMGETGKANMIKYINKGPKFKSKMIYYDGDSNFFNPASFVRPDAKLFSVNNTYELTDVDILQTQGFYYKDKKEDKISKQLYQGYKRIINSTTTLDIGGKYTKNETDGDIKPLVTLGSKLTWGPSNIEGLINYLEFEQDIDDSSKKRLGVGSEYIVNKYLKLYGKYDFISTLPDTTVIDRFNVSYKKLYGFELGTLDYLRFYTEYREHDNDTFDKEVAFGFKNNVDINKNLNFSSVFERVIGVNKDKSTNKNDKTNFLFSYGYKDEKTNTSVGDLNFTIENEITSILSRLAYGRKIKDDLTFAVKNRYYIQDMKKNKKKDRFLLGIAYRDSKDIYNSLIKYEINYDNGIDNKGYKHLANIISTTHNIQLKNNLVTTFSLGGKYVQDENIYAVEKYFAYMLGFNTRYYATEKIDLGLNTAVYIDDKSMEKYGVGIELGYTLDNNFWISVGYNFLGFRDKDFFNDDDYSKGIYLRFRLKFDEGILNRF